jgi:hypothetical protein
VAIRALDGGAYSHAAIWAGACNVVESTTPEVVAHTLDESLVGHPRKYVDVYRRKTPRKGIRIVQEALCYQGRPYPKGELYLLALLLAASTSIPNDRAAVAFLKQTCKLEAFLKATQGKQPREDLVTCSALVAQSHFDAASSFRVVPERGKRVDWGAIAAAWWELQGSRITLKAFEASPYEEEALDPAEWGEFQEQLRAKFQGATGVDPVPSPPTRGIAKMAAMDADDTSPGLEAGGSAWNASRVTPHALETSPDLTPLGCLFDGATIARLSPAARPGARPKGSGP